MRCLITSALIALAGTSSGSAGVVFVSSLGTDEVLRYDAMTGAYQDVFIAAGSGGLDEPHAILERCEDLLVASFPNHRILRYDRATGAFLGIWADSGSGLNLPVYMQYGPDTRLYVSSQGSDEILRFESDGAFVDAFVTAGSGGLDGPSGFAFGPDGRLYVAGRYSANIIAFDGSTGAFDEVIADGADGLGAGTTFGLAFGDNGDLYVASNGNVFRYDLDSASIAAAVPLTLPIGLEPGPSGGVYVATGNNLQVINTADNSVSLPFLAGGTINTLNFFRFEDSPGTLPCPSTVPTVSGWGTCLMGLIALTAGSLILRRRWGGVDLEYSPTVCE